RMPEHRAPLSAKPTAHATTASRPPELLYARGAAQQKNIGAACRKQSVGDDADDTVDARLEVDGIADRQAMHIEDHVAVVGHDALAPFWRSAKLAKLARHVIARHRNHFDWQRKAAEHGDPFTRIRDADEATRYRGDDLFARQRGATALDHRKP